MISLASISRPYVAELRRRPVTDSRVADVERTLRRFAGGLARLCLARGRGGDIALDRITREGVEAWIEERRADVAGGTVRKELSILQAAGRWAIDRGLWAVLAENVRWLRVRAPRVRPLQPEALTPEEFAHTLRDFPQHVRLPILAVYLLGDRPGAIYALQWGDRFLAGDARSARHGFVRLRERKGGRPRSVAFAEGDEVDLLFAAAAVAFETRVGRPPRRYDPVFINARTNRWHSDTLPAAVRYYLERRHRRRGFRPYVARHSGAQLAAVEGGSSTEIQAFLGHDRRETGEVYVDAAGVDASDVRARMAMAWRRAIRGLLGE